MLKKKGGRISSWEQNENARRRSTSIPLLPLALAQERALIKGERTRTARKKKK
jgi:hypothetical protein